MKKLALFFIILLNISFFALLVTLLVSKREVNMDMVVMPTTAITNDSIAQLHLRELALKNTYIDERLARQDKFIDILYNDQDNYLSWITIIVTALGIGIAIAGIGISIFLNSKISSMEKDVEAQIKEARAIITAKSEKMQKVIAEMEALQEDVKDRFEEIEVSRGGIEKSKAKVDKMVQEVEAIKIRLPEIVESIIEDLKEETDKAKKQIDKDIQKYSEIVSGAEKKRVKELWKKADKQVKKGDTDKNKDEILKAIALYEEVLESDESLSQVYADIGYAYVTLGEITKNKEYYKNAINFYDKFIEKSKGSVSAYNNSALATERYYGLAMTEEQKDEVQKNYEKAVELGSQIAVKNLIIRSKTNIDESLKWFKIYCTQEFSSKINATRSEIEKDTSFSTLHGNPKFIELLNENFSEKDGKQIYK